MTEHCCQRCGYTTDHLPNLVRHLHRKKLCKPVLEDKDPEKIIEEEREKEKLHKQYQCEHCNKRFNSRQSKSRHMKTCKGVVTSHSSDTISTTSQVVQQNATTINNNITNITNNTIVLNDFSAVTGKHISSDDILKLIAQVKREDKYYDVFQTVLKKIYFDPAHPENHTIKIPNRRDKYCQVVTGGRIQFAKKKEKVDQTIDTTHVTLHGVYDENEYHPHITMMNRQVMSKMNKKYYDDDEDHMDRLRDDTTLSILNNQHLLPCQSSITQM